VTSRQIMMVGTGAVLLLTVGVLDYHAVDADLTEEDRLYIPRYLALVSPLPDDPDYEDELAFIMAVQHAVLQIAPASEGIPEGQLREPMQLFQAKSGLCYDRSRVIEKILQYSGFQTRHIFILSHEQQYTPIQAILTRGVQSHAVTEVLTQKSWLVVDSNTDWVSLTEDGSPVSMDRIHAFTQGAPGLAWSRAPPFDIYTLPFTYIYGLHSRHGRFFPPFNPVPDIHYGEFMRNLF